MQHPRFKPGFNEEPDQESGRNQQPGRDGRWKHLHGEPDYQDGRVHGYQPDQDDGWVDEQQPGGWVEFNQPDQPGRTQCRQVIGAEQSFQRVEIGHEKCCQKCTINIRF